MQENLDGPNQTSENQAKEGGIKQEEEQPEESTAMMYR